jgi:hypothetical protein
MKYIIQVKAKNETRYLQIRKEDQPLWLYEEFKQNATMFETIKDATKTIGEMIADWSWETYTILEVGAICEAGETKATEQTYYPVKEISISDYN